MLELYQIINKNLGLGVKPSPFCCFICACIGQLDYSEENLWEKTLIKQIKN